MDSFSRGSPESACEEDMRPRHGFATQVPFPRNWLILSSFLWFNMHDQTLSLNFGENGLSTWRVIYLHRQTQVREVKYFAQFVFPPVWATPRICLHFLFCLTTGTLTDWAGVMTSRLFYFMKVCAQAGKPPAEIVVDQSEVRQDHYLRVTLRYQGGN